MSRALPLKGIRIVNFGWIWAGPAAGQPLGLLGAEVLKIESHARIDMLRTIPPFAAGEVGPDRSLTSNACWAGHGSVSLNLKKPEARALALELVARSDVVIENFGFGVMEKLGLSYEDLCRTKRDIIMLSMPAAGLTGPLKEVRTYGLSLASITGLDSLVGYKNGGPIPMESSYTDPLAGIFGAFAVLAALRYRDNSGQGQHVDFSQQEAVAQLVGPAYIDYALNGRIGAPKGNEHPVGAAAPHGVFPCAGRDRWISVAVPSEEEWKSLLEAMGQVAWALAERFSTLGKRLAHIDALHRRFAEWTAGFDDRKLAATLQSHGVAAAPVLNVADLLSDPHFVARKTFIEVKHPLGYRETIYGAYVKTSHSEVAVEPGPSIGQDNERVLKGLLGISPKRYAELVADGVIF